MNIKRLNIVGAGAWGTALASVVSRVDRQAMIWAYEEEVAHSINNDHQNYHYLPGVKLPKALKASSRIEDVLNCDALLLVAPAQLTRRVCEQLKQADISPTIPILICSKGIENNTALLLSEVVAEVLPKQAHIAVLSGPNFAKEVAQMQPAASTLACRDDTTGRALVTILGSAEFRTYLSHDIIGAQICGAVKNVLAIACGIARGKGFGENVVAALITRGLFEIGRLIEAKGGQKETITGLCGVGDVMLTCSSLTSRNTSFGNLIGKGASVEEATAQQKGITEGYFTTQSVYQIIQKLKIEMPICQAVYDILYQKQDIDEVIHHLFARPLTMDY